MEQLRCHVANIVINLPSNASNFIDFSKSFNKLSNLDKILPISIILPIPS